MRGHLIVKLTDVPAFIYDRETAAGHYETILDFKRSLGLAQYFLQGRNAPISRSRNQGVKMTSVLNEPLNYPENVKMGPKAPEYFFK